MLGGELGEKYGTEHEYYNLQSPADAIKLLCINYPALQKDLIEAHHNGIGYKVIQGGAAMGYDELHLPFGSRPLLVVPVISGSGGSTGTILLGVGLVAAAIMFAPAGAGFLGAGLGIGSTTTATFSLQAGAYIASTSAVLSAGMSTAIGAIGASLVLAGTANLISPQPEVPRLRGDRLDGGTNVRGTGPQGVTRGASGEQSYAFRGPSNTVGTGATIPVIYGRVITGGHLLSMDVDISDESDPLRKTLGGFNRNEVRINDEKIKNKMIELGDLKTIKFTDKKRAQFTSSSNRNRVRLDKTYGGNLKELVRIKSSKLRDTFRKKDDDNVAENELMNYIKSEKKEEMRDKVDVMFELTNSLYDYVGDETTTIIDGFISYAIELRLKGVKGAVGKPLVSQGSATLQGKFKSNNRKPFYYGHRFEVPRVKSADHIELAFKITDASVNDAVTLKLIGFGYKILDG